MAMILKRKNLMQLSLLALALLIYVLPLSPLSAQESTGETVQAQEQARPAPGIDENNLNDAEMWRAVKRGVRGEVSIPDRNAAQLMQPEGENWRLLRNGPMNDYFGLAMLATLILLAVFFALRGRIQIEGGRSDILIRRFRFFERATHWLMATSFIVLALSGLNVVFGRQVLIPVIGKEAFAPLTYFLKLAHNYAGFAFMLGLALAFIFWVARNIPRAHDLTWLARGGGMIGKGHAPAGKFNAGQKIIFWLTMLGGLSLSISGWALLFPYSTDFFSSTFGFFHQIGIPMGDWFGVGAPPYASVVEQQMNSVWHGVVAIAMICLIFAHIYLGTVGMEGAFEAMGDGQVDTNWAREHHNLWVEELREKEGVRTSPSMARQPAE